jgi:hypothetical protein
MGFKDLVGGNHGIEEFDRKRSWDRTIESEEIIELQWLIAENHEIEGSVLRKS